MKITKTDLKQIIKEEYNRLVSEGGVTPAGRYVPDIGSKEEEFSTRRIRREPLPTIQEPTVKFSEEQFRKAKELKDKFVGLGIDVASIQTGFLPYLLSAVEQAEANNEHTFKSQVIKSPQAIDDALARSEGEIKYQELMSKPNK